MADETKYELLENETQTVLQDYLGKDNVDVEVEPQFEGENIQPYAKTRVTIFIDQSEFDKTKNSKYMAQDENAKLMLLVRSKKLRGQYGVYDTCDKIRKRMVGYLPTNWSKMWLIKISFDERSKGMWHYVVVIGTKSMIVEEHVEVLIPKIINSGATYDDAQFN